MCEILYYSFTSRVLLPTVKHYPKKEKQTLTHILFYDNIYFVLSCIKILYKTANLSKNIWYNCTLSLRKSVLEKWIFFFFGNNRNGRHFFSGKFYEKNDVCHNPLSRILLWVLKEKNINLQHFVLKWYF